MSDTELGLTGDCFWGLESDQRRLTTSDVWSLFGDFGLRVLRKPSKKCFLHLGGLPDGGGEETGERMDDGEECLTSVAAEESSSEWSVGEHGSDAIFAVTSETGEMAALDGILVFLVRLLRPTLDSSVTSPLTIL